MLLLAYVRFKKDEKICEELLFAKLILNENRYFMQWRSSLKKWKSSLKKKEISLSILNILSVATDSAPATIERYMGFLAYLKKKVLNVLVFVVLCVFHRQHVKHT